MSQLNRIFQFIRKRDEVEVDRAMAAALPTADEQARRLMVLCLLERGTTQGMAALVEHYHKLPEDLQQRVVRRSGQLYKPLREIAEGASPEAVSNVVEIVRASGGLKLTYLVIQQLHHGRPAMRDKAAQCLFELAQQATAPRGAEPACSAAEMQYLLDAVEESVERFHLHQKPHVLRAMATLMPRPMGKAAKALADARHPASRALAALLASPNDPALDAAMLCLIDVPALRADILDGLSRLPAGPRLLGLVTRSHLLMPGPCVRALRKMQVIAPLLPTPAVLRGLQAHEARGLPRWLALLPMSATDRVEQLARLLQQPDPLTRLSALQRLIHQSQGPGSDPEAAHRAIALAARDSEPRIALVAVRYLLQVNYAQLPKLLPELLNTGHDEVVHVLGQCLSARGFARLFDQWPKMTRQQRLASGKALIKIDDHFHRQLGDKLLVPDPSLRQRALSIIGELGQGHLFEAALLVLCDDPDEKVASAAVKALAACPSATTREKLRAALDHRDSRVRANAIESLEALNDTQHVPRLLEIAQRDKGRPRANAIKALLQMRSDEALGHLHRMLRDPDANQKISALWVVEHMGVLDMARQVADLSALESDMRVKQRATRVVETMIRNLRVSA